MKLSGISLARDKHEATIHYYIHKNVINGERMQIRRRSHRLREGDGANEWNNIICVVVWAC
jgi:hypothetical protein